MGVGKLMSRIDLIRRKVNSSVFLDLHSYLIWRRLSVELISWTELIKDVITEI